MEIENNEGVLTKEQINELTEKAKLADELKVKLEQAESEKTGLVEEIKEERKKKQEAAELARAAMEGKSDDPNVKTRSIVQEVLNEEKTRQIEMSRKSFEENFKSSNPEFQPTNDPAGLKWSAFQKTLAKLNISNLSTEKEFAEIYGDAMVLLNKTKPEQKDSNINPYAFTPSSKSSVQESDSKELSPKEKKLLQTSGMSMEKYLKLKVSQPNYVAGLLQHVRD